MLLRPVTTVIGVVGRVDRDDRELVTGQADDHVHVVARLDDGADAGDLVDLDAPCERKAGWVSRSAGRYPRSPPVEGRRRDLGALGDRLADDLADHLGRIDVSARA